MAKIIYGVHGTGHGHAMRALTLARHFSEHEFLFLSHGDGAELLQGEHRVVNCPNPVTPVRLHQVDIPALIKGNTKVFLKRKQLLSRVLKELEDFKPDVALTDYEFFVPQASRLVGLPCLSLDHQHVITCCSHRIPVGQLYSYLATYQSIKRLFSNGSDHIVTSFFLPPLKKGEKTRLVPPLLRQSVLEVAPEAGEHVLAYHGYGTAQGFFDFLEAIPRKVLVYGSDIDSSRGNLVFKKRSGEEFLQDLASSCYVVGSSGQTLISEALYYGKPLVLFPIKNAFEQYINGLYLERLGYGRSYTDFKKGLGDINSVENNLDYFQENISKADPCGNQEVFSLVTSFIKNGVLPPILK
jgi:uncharacterized protein (TIGR00661 family)